MTKTLIKPRFFSNKIKQKFKPQIENFQPQIPPDLQSFKQKFLSGDGFLKYKQFYKM